MTPIYIFDLDGTLALAHHRVHLLKEVPEGPERWRRFYDGCDQDVPNAPLVELLKTLMREGNDVRIWTGRSDEVEAKTRAWLDTHLGSNYRLGMDIRMRRAGDYTPDHDLKRQWLGELSEGQRNRIAMVFEDRSRVVQMWRDAGLVCCQVAPGDF